MGGSVAVHVAAKRALPSLAGLVVVDVVEVCFLCNSLVNFFLFVMVFCNFYLNTVIIFQGTAMASLIHMQQLLSSRMQHFSSLEKAVFEIPSDSQSFPSAHSLHSMIL
jgi:protein phosphatase methylesterase 1